MNSKLLINYAAASRACCPYRALYALGNLSIAAKAEALGCTPRQVNNILRAYRAGRIRCLGLCEVYPQIGESK